MTKKPTFLLMLILMLVLTLAGGLSAAQDSTPTPTPTATTAVGAQAGAQAAPTATPTPEGAFVARVVVRVESGFARLAPSLEAEPAASLFLDDPLIVVGRNADGLWFEVRRPGRLTNLGWVFNEILDWEFNVADLPLTDGMTDLLGPTPVEDTTGVSVLLLAEALLRDYPYSGNVITTVPIGVTVPVIYRNQDASALQVNYRGYVGWISNLTYRQPPNVDALAVAPGLPPLPQVNVIIVPPEVQMAQVERLRAFVEASYSVADQLASLWYAVFTGQIMPCEAPPFVTEYLYGAGDVQQLPELDRYVPRVNEAVRYLNEAIEPLTICGVFQVDIVLDARNNAINARGIFAANLQQLDNLEAIILRYNR